MFMGIRICKVCMHIHVYTYIHIYKYVNGCISVLMYIYTSVFICHTCIISMCLCINGHMYMYLYLYAHIYVSMCWCISVLISAFICTYRYMCLCITVHIWVLSAFTQCVVMFSDYRGVQRLCKRA